MSVENKRTDYSQQIVTTILCLVVILLAIAYNNLRNENISLQEIITQNQQQDEEYVRHALLADSDELEKLENRVKKLEESVFKTNKR